MLRLLAVAVIGLVLLRVPVSGAAFVGSTANDGNSAAALTVAAPPTASTTMALNITPLLTCEATVSWTASSTAEVTGYEVVRIDVSSGLPDAGPWSTAGLSHVDDPVPMWVLGSGYEWRVRSVVGAWRSAWTVATMTNPLLCLL